MAPVGSDTQRIGDLYVSFMDTARIESVGLISYTYVDRRLLRLHAGCDMAWREETAERQRRHAEAPAGHPQAHRSRETRRAALTL